MCHLHYIKQVPSTNDYVKSILSRERPPELSLYLAEVQTKGRGQRGNTWHAKAGKNHTGTIIFYPSFLPPAKQFQISKLISIAIIKTLSSYLNPANLSVKWPNDIFYLDKKIAGILIETSLLGEQFDYLIAGMGININQLHFDRALPNPTSIKKITQRETNITSFNTNLHQNIRTIYKKNTVLGPALDSWYHNHLYRLGESHPYQAGEEKFRATILGVSESGQLILKTASNDIRHYGFKEIEFIGS